MYYNKLILRLSETLDKSFEDTLQSLKDKYSSSVSESCKDVLTEEDGQKTFHVEVLERLVLLTEVSWLL